MTRLLVKYHLGWQPFRTFSTLAIVKDAQLSKCSQLIFLRVKLIYSAIDVVLLRILSFDLADVIFLSAAVPR